MPIERQIGFDARLIGSLGIGRYVSGLLPALARSLEGRLMVISQPQDVALVRALTEGSASIMGSRAQPYRLAEQTTLLVQLAARRLEMMHFPHYSLPLAYPGRFVVTIHDLFPYQFPEIHSRRVPRFTNQALLSSAAKRAETIITPSRATAEEVSRRFPSRADRVVAIPEAAGGRFEPERVPEAEDAWQRYFGIRPPYFLFLGQWKAYKNVPLLIKAFASLHRRRPDTQLVIGGHDARHPEIPEAAASLPAGSVVLPGHLPDDAIPDLYRGAAAVVVASRAEGFGLPVLEAMACGVVVICSDIPVLHEVAGDVAIFADPNNDESFASAMLGALDHAAMTDRIARGIERARRFSWRKAADETLRVYERALARRPSTRSETD